MRFTVVSRPIADDELASIYLQAPNRREVDRACRIIERTLKQRGRRGAAVAPGRHYFTAYPLTVAFDVSLDDCMLVVVGYEYHP